MTARTGNSRQPLVVGCKVRGRLRNRHLTTGYYYGPASAKLRGKALAWIHRPGRPLSLALADTLERCT